MSNFSGKGHLYFHKNAKGNNDINYIEGASLRIDKDNVDINKNIEVDIIDIKKILNDYQKIDLIKIDIEGFEYEAILGSKELFSQGRVRNIALELHDSTLFRRGKKMEDITRFLESCGYFVNLKYSSWSIIPRALTS